MNYYPFHIGDYASATRHLSWDEDAAYRRLLDAYYVRETPLPLEMRAVYRLVGAASEEQRVAVETVLQEFFQKTEDGWRHARCDAEITAANIKRDKASQSAHARWDKANAGKQHAGASKNDANASGTACEGNAPNPNPNPNPKDSLRSSKARRKCPDYFAVTEDMRAWASREAPSIDVDRETTKFRNHTFKTARVDWPATWQNWLLEAQDRLPRRSQAPPPQSFRQRDADAAAGRVAQMTGGLVSAKRPTEVFDVAARTVDRPDFLEDDAHLRLGVAAHVGRR